MYVTSLRWHGAVESLIGERSHQRE
jgi:hypothetical protein